MLKHPLTANSIKRRVEESSENPRERKKGGYNVKKGSEEMFGEKRREVVKSAGTKKLYSSDIKGGGNQLHPSFKFTRSRPRGRAARAAPRPSDSRPFQRRGPCRRATVSSLQELERKQLAVGLVSFFPTPSTLHNPRRIPGVEGSEVVLFAVLCRPGGRGMFKNTHPRRTDNP